MEGFKVLSGAKGQTTRAIQFYEALAVRPSLDNDSCSIPYPFVVVSVRKYG